MQTIKWNQSIENNINSVDWTLILRTEIFRKYLIKEKNHKNKCKKLLKEILKIKNKVEKKSFF